MSDRPKIYNTIFAIFVFLLAACGTDQGASTPVIINPEPPTNPSTEPVVTRDIQYGEGQVIGGSMPLFLDLYEPAEDCSQNRPTTLFVHGGGFTGGNKRSDNTEELAREMTKRGTNFVSIQYRLNPDEPLPSAPFVEVMDDLIAAAGGNVSDDRVDAIAAAFEDTVTALNFLEANQDSLCSDTNRLAYWGSSAGAYTVLQVAYGLNQFGIQRPDPMVVIDYWGNLFRDSDLEVGEAPFLIVHGTEDRTVSYQDAIDLADQADVVGVRYALYSVIGAGHGYGATGVNSNRIDGQTLLERTGDFVETHLFGEAPVYGRFNINP